MYEFLDDKLKYENLDEYQRSKADWIQESKQYTFDTQQTYWRVLNKKVNPIENAKGKDLYDFDKQEIMKLVKYMPTKRISMKLVAYSAIVRYMEWACDKGLNYVGNPCDTIDTKEILTINELALQESYKTLQEFYDFIYGLECTDVDRAMFTLIRYGVSIDEVGKIAWEDVDKENKELITSKNGIKLVLPIDNIFIMIMDRAKTCQTYETKVVNECYIDNGYIIKQPQSTDWITISGTDAYNKIARISKTNKISRISVPELNLSRKFDLLFDKLDKKKTVDGNDIEEVNLLIDGVAGGAKNSMLKRDFEMMSGTTVFRKKHKNSKTKVIENKDIDKEVGIDIDDEDINVGNVNDSMNIDNND